MALPTSRYIMFLFILLNLINLNLTYYMKKLSTLLFSILAVSATYAQPAFTSVVIPADGYTASVQSASYTGADPSADGGANKTWDYSALVFGGAAATSSISTNVAGSPYGASFPTATHVETSGGGDYNYYKYTSTSVSIVGYYSQTTVAYSNALTEMTLPIAYTDVQTDTYSGNYMANGFPVAVTGTVTTTYDGHGTLITPNGTYNN